MEKIPDWIEQLLMPKLKRDHRRDKSPAYTHRWSGEGSRGFEERDDDEV